MYASHFTNCLLGFLAYLNITFCWAEQGLKPTLAGLFEPVTVRPYLVHHVTVLLVSFTKNVASSKYGRCSEMRQGNINPSVTKQ